MSTGLSRRQSQSSKKSGASIHPAPAPTLTPENGEQGLQASAATGQYLLLGQGTQVLCLRHGTLAIEKRFDKHKEDVAWISVDNISDRGNGRIAVSYDVGNTAIIWDIHTGDELSRFAAYEAIKVAAWMKNGNVVFGNSTGNIIHFDPITSEHISTRTIFDPITAIAPSLDCRTYAVGFMNGSIMIISVHPVFTIHHTLSTQRRPSPVSTVAWHGGSGRHKTDMLATQTADGDLRVWNIPRSSDKGHIPQAIRIISMDEGIVSGPNWFAWSRNGRIIQHSDRRTRMHDMRTKQVIVSPLNTYEGLVGICNYGPTSTLFTIHKNWVIHQWDLNPDGEAYVVKEVQHIPAVVPPSPPGSIDESKGTTLPPVLPTFSESEASEPEKQTLSPLQRIAREMDEIEEERERRDRLAPLSPGSSRSSTSSKSSGRRLPTYLYDKPSSRASTGSRESGTEFSMGQSLPRPRDSQSTRSSTSYRSSLLRREVMRSPEDAVPGEILDLFPVTRSRIQDVVFKAPNYGEGTRTPDLLRKEMLNVVFGWQDDIKPLIRDEMMRHPAGSSRAVLLAKWLGELSTDSMISMMGSESMTSSDWMLLALGSIGKDSQKKVGEAFVQRLLEKGDIHPAVAILLGLGEYDDAIEAYVSQKCFMEALLLTCLATPANWERQCFLLRKWGEVAVKTGSPELAVRIFSCTSEETTGPWFSPRAQDAIYAAQKEQVLGPASLSPPGSPPSAGPSARFNAKNAPLKLITSFGDRGVPLLPKVDDVTPMNSIGAGVTPIAQSALSPGGQGTWLREARKERDPASARSARTATPGAYGRKRMPSREQKMRIPQETPQTASRDFAVSTVVEDDVTKTVRKQTHRRVSSVGGQALPETLSPARYQPGDRKASDPSYLPSPAVGAFARLREENHARNGSRDRMPDGLRGMKLEIFDTYEDTAASPAPSTHATSRSGFSMASNLTGRSGAVSPPLTAGSSTSVKSRAIDPYISSIEQARVSAKAAREKSRPRGESRTRPKKERSQSRGRHDVKFIRPAKRSPSSPVPMSPDEVLAATQAAAASREGRADSPVDVGRARSRSNMRFNRGTSRARSPEKLQVERGRSNQRGEGSVGRSPSSPGPISPETTDKKDEEMNSDGRRVRLRSTSRKPQSRAASTARAHDSRKAAREDSGLGLPPASSFPKNPLLSRKELAAKELEERRLSLVRRPSAPAVPMPSEITQRPEMPPRYHTELGDSPTSFLPPYSHNPSRSQSVDADAMSRPFPRSAGASSPSVHIGLPATPKAMMHQRYMSESRGSIPEVPPIPSHHDSPQEDQLGPLLPSTTFGQPSPEPRSASAPLERNDLHPALRGYKAAIAPSNLRRNSLRGHSRSQTHDGPLLPSPQQHSPPIITASIDETIHESDVVVVNVDDPPLLPELQHLAGPPPPPPIPAPPTDFRRHSGPDNKQGLIDISLDAASSPPSQPRNGTPILPLERAATSSPTATHRRGRNSISESKSFGNRIRNVTERMRSTSRSNNKSPTISGPIAQQSPYETVLPPFPANGGAAQGHVAPGPVGPLPRHGRRESLNSLRTSTKSPYDASVSGNSTNGMSGADTPSYEYQGQGGWISRPGTAPGVAAGQHLSRPGTAPLQGESRSASAMGGTMSSGLGQGQGYGSLGQGGEAEQGQRKGSASGYIRNPKEIRANMPPETLQMGVYVPPNGGYVREREGSSGGTVTAAGTGGRGLLAREGS
ncbi:p21-activated protein kinase-interacting protein 1-like [Elsinoe australis]|uniref:p21-activated protein kinase-interacting protein 1-like n=1 Tax=Elsinoe australis TaxID=40998 RepID=A0A2P8AFY6_9PEZI|nr:p21-activated protein kinase-interacting protein 1-like [Elsinoe australis]